MQEFRLYSKACVMDGIVLNFLMDLCYDLILFPHLKSGPFHRTKQKQLLLMSPRVKFLHDFCA